MKKVLLGTSALLAAGMFASAAEAAQPLKLTVGGYLDAFIGYNDLKKEYNANKFDVATLGELVFEANTKLDNGIKVGAVAQIELDDLYGNGEWLGDVFAYAETKWGKVEMGATDNVAVKMHNSVFDASGVWGTDKTKLVNWLGVTPTVTLDSTAINFDGNAQKISYFTPKFAGFTAGLSWVPGADSAGAFNEFSGAYDNTVQRAAPDFRSAYVISAAYEGKFSSVTVGADVAFGYYNIVGGSNAANYSAGLKVGVAGFSVGAGYKMVDYDTTGIGDDKIFDIGLGYENGPYAVSASYLKSKDGKPFKDELEIWQVSGKYKLGAGVDAFATFGYLDLDDKTSTKSLSNTDVWTIVTGLALTF